MSSVNTLASKIFPIALSCFCIYYALAADTLFQGGDALNSTNTLVSKNGFFTLGFQRIGSADSNARYLGIWYNNDTTQIFWLANRDRPIADDSGVLAVDGSGNMKLTYSGGDLIDIYSSQSSTANLTAVLEDSGNFVLKDANSPSDQILWQSFDSPTDTLLPGMKLGINRRTGRNWSLTSWLSDLVPASGAFFLEWDPNGQELVITRRGVTFWTSGPLRNNDSFENFSLYSGTLDFSFINVSNANEDYFMFTVARNEYSPQDQRNFSMWNLVFDGSIMDQNSRRVYGVCDGYSTQVGCERRDGSITCRSDGYRFEQRLGNFDNRVPTVDNNASLSISDCKDICWKDCQCSGTNIANANGTGCIFWHGNIIQDLSGNQVRRYAIIRDTPSPPPSPGEKNWIWILVAVAVALIIVLVGILLYLRRRRLREKLLNELMTLDTPNDLHELENDRGKGHNLAVYSAATIMAATNNFSPENKLGQGGFGPVYKGKLPEGQEIAVKRLSRSSGQGLVEFKNELVVIAKLQHINLVRLFGCCIQGEEKMLVYEYMPNKSLDSFIFDQSKRKMLDWKKHFAIVEGIAQGLLYLHKYSRLRIIHRDLKASNILLDENMNPKISDFGMARIFKTNELEANTNRLVGTYGYMSPEYAMEGLFSIKSDVFSFGVLLLEILSGRKNYGLVQIDPPLNLVGYAWELWKEGNPFELAEPTIRDSCSKDQVLRCINVGLLCVEDKVVDRPIMSEVISMLTSEVTQLPYPKHPAFSNGRSTMDMDLINKSERSSVNVLSTSIMDPR